MADLKRETHALILNSDGSPLSKSRRSQVTLFIIIGIVIIAAVILILVLRVGNKVDSVPANLQSPYDSFSKCLEDKTSLGVKLLLTQGGYIGLPEFEPGSSYMPFSSQLDFAGTNFPYWYYVSGNNIQKEQVPSRSEMEKDLAKFVEENSVRCNLDSFLDEGYKLSQDTKSAKAVIKDNLVEIDIDMGLSISKGEDSVSVGNHKIVVPTNLGKLYDSALSVYNKEQKELFLEQYAVDALRLYAPVDGVEIKCSPLIWNADEIFNDLEEGIEANTLSLKSSGDKNDYFYVEGLPENARFINSRNWARGFEVDPAQGPVLMATPVGNQPGLGVLGFCYIAYHFVYNVKYPVLIQTYEGEEIFQFPVAVVIQGNKPREALISSGLQEEIPDFCKYKNSMTEVEVYDLKNSPVDADVSYDCAGTSCYIGKTKKGVLVGEFPQCVNGRVIAKAEGYEEGSEIYSSVDSGRVKILTSRLHEINVSLLVDGQKYSGDAVISFSSNESSKTIVYPEQKSVELSQGDYQVQVYVYKNSTLVLGESVQEQCMEVPYGVLGIVGITKKKCFEIKVPEQVVSNALSGGGKQNYYLADSRLQSSNSIQIDVESLPVPDSLEQLQVNYILYEE